VSASTVQVENKAVWNMEFSYNLRPTPPGIDPNIDDPVNDTGLEPHRGDPQMSHEFACLLSVMCAQNGAF
jgi:hypothetical protein